MVIIMINSKQRAQLRSMANTMETIIQVGKLGINENLIKQTVDTLSARELIKMRVLENSPLTAREAAAELSAVCGADVVQVIGTRFVLYKANPENPVIVLD